MVIPNLGADICEWKKLHEFRRVWSSLILWGHDWLWNNSGLNFLNRSWNYKGIDFDGLVIKSWQIWLIQQIKYECQLPKFRNRGWEQDIYFWVGRSPFRGILVVINLEGIMTCFYCGGSSFLITFGWRVFNRWVVLLP